MGKNQKKRNVFKVAGARSLKKQKAKAVNLGLKNMKQKVQDIDAEFVEINKNPKSNTNSNREKAKPIVTPKKPGPSKEEVSKTADKIDKMDL